MSALAIISKVLQAVGNNMDDAGNKMKTKQGGGMDALGPEFRAGGEQTTHQGMGVMDQAMKPLGQALGQKLSQGIGGNQSGANGANGAGADTSSGAPAGSGADAGAAAGGTSAASGVGGGGGYAVGGYVDASDERIKEATPQKDLLSEVAESINNYTYHYKPDTGEDPSVEYSGPMAQELLQVDGYRSAVFENPETGLLEVDTGRLAMTNTGMIADLTKRLLLMEEFVKAIMAGLPQMAQEQSSAPAQPSPQGQPDMPDVE